MKLTCCSEAWPLFISQAPPSTFLAVLLMIIDWYMDTALWSVCSAPPISYVCYIGCVFHCNISLVRIYGTTISGRVVDQLCETFLILFSLLFELRNVVLTEYVVVVMYVTTPPQGLIGIIVMHFQCGITLYRIPLSSPCTLQTPGSEETCTVVLGTPPLCVEVFWIYSEPDAYLVNAPLWPTHSH